MSVEDDVLMEFFVPVSGSVRECAGCGEAMRVTDVRAHRQGCALLDQTIWLCAASVNPSVPSSYSRGWYAGFLRSVAKREG